MQLATKFTFCRIISAPFFFVLYFLPDWLKGISFLPALSTFLIIPLLAFAEYTDYLDGKYARKLNQVSNFGKVFDPFADVFLNITVFFCLVLSGYMPAIILLLIIYREISMTFIRMAAMQEGVAIGASKGGKIKTVIYIISCFFALAIEGSLRIRLFDPAAMPIRIGKIISLVLFIICLVLSYISFIDYLINFKNVLIKKK